MPPNYFRTASSVHRFGTHGQFIEADTEYAQNLMLCKHPLRIHDYFTPEGVSASISRMGGTENEEAASRKRLLFRWPVTGLQERTLL
jgi:hypothetical protein